MTLRSEYRRRLNVDWNWKHFTLKEKIADLERTIVQFSRHMEKHQGTYIPGIRYHPLVCIAETRDYLAELQNPKPNWRKIAAEVWAEKIARDYRRNMP